MRWSSARNVELAQDIERAQPLLGTFVSIKAHAVGQRAHSAISAAFARIADIQRTMSFHDPDSELSRLNCHAYTHPQPVSTPLCRVLRAALALAKASDGLFDPTVAWRLVEQGFLPAPDATATDPGATWRDVCLLHDGTVSFRRPLWIDLGGIAKGFAVDQAVRSLLSHHVTSGVVNAGGDLRIFGRMEAVSVRDPACPHRQIPMLHVRNAAVATSAGYFTNDEGRTPLIHPARGASLGQNCSVTVCARRAIWADALTKIVLAAPDTAAPLLARLDASAVMLFDDGTRRQVA